MKERKQMVPAASASEIRKSVRVSTQDLKAAKEALGLIFHPHKKHVASPVSATEIRKSLGVTDEDLKTALDSLKP